MSDRFGSQPPDEPIIGANPPPRTSPFSQPRSPVIGSEYPDESATTPEPGWQDDEAYDDEYDYGDEDEGYYDDEYYDGTPARQPMFYVFIALAAIVGGIFIFLLYSLVTDSDSSTPTKTTELKIVIDQPGQNEHIETGKGVTISARAIATEPITRIELLINGNTVDQFLPQAPAPTDLIYAHSFTWRFSAKGDYKIAVKATSESGETRSSEAIAVVAFEGVGDKPVIIKGKVLASVSMRTGPGESYEAVGRLNPGDDVNVIGKTRDLEWLLVDSNNQQRWVPRTAIELSESLALVGVREPTPAPATPTNTPSASPSPSPSPSATTNPKAPDFAPTNAVLIDGGKTLRVTINNLSGNAYSGALVVSVAGLQSGTVSLAFNVNIPANGSTTVDFEANVTGPKSIQVKVDPENAIKEANEDNNVATFALTLTVEQPQIVITAIDVQASTINVTVKNNGGSVQAAQLTARVTLTATGASTELPKAIPVLATGQIETFSVPKLGSGAAKVEVLLNGVTVASQNVTLPP